MIDCEYLKGIKTDESEITVFGMTQEGIMESNGVKIIGTLSLLLGDILQVMLDDRVPSRRR